MTANMKVRFIIALTVIIASSSKSQPALRLVRSSEYGPTFSGTFGGNPLNCFGVAYLWPSELDWESTLPDPSIDPLMPRKIMRLNVEIVNVGSEPWCVGDVWTYPNRYRYLSLGAAVHGLFGISLSETNGTLVRFRLVQWSPLWDVFPALRNLPRYSAVWDPCISPAHAAISSEPYLSGSLIDITGIPDGIYVLRVMLDPTDEWGLRNPATDIAGYVKLEAMSVVPYTTGVGGGDGGPQTRAFPIRRPTR